MSFLLFDEDVEDADQPIVPEGRQFENCLVVGPVAASSEALNEIELEYRRTGNRPPILFIDMAADLSNIGGDEVPRLGNAETIAKYLGVSPNGLTLERAERLMMARWQAGQASQ